MNFNNLNAVFMNNNHNFALFEDNPSESDVPILSQTNLITF